MTKTTDTVDLGPDSGAALRGAGWLALIAGLGFGIWILVAFGTVPDPSFSGVGPNTNLVPSMVILGISMMVLGVVACAGSVVLAAIAEDVRRLRIMRETDGTLAERVIAGD